jgi:hypothetical protein
MKFVSSTIVSCNCHMFLICLDTAEKTTYVTNYGYLMSVGLRWINRKIGKIVTLYQRELFQEYSTQGTFCTQSVNEGLNCNDRCSLPRKVATSDIHLVFTTVSKNTGFYSPMLSLYQCKLRLDLPLQLLQTMQVVQNKTE